MTALPILSGIIASAIHVVSGPDHLAAVTPIVVESKRKAWRVGLFWGLGHIAGMLAIGLLVFFFKELIPFEAISAYSEQLVGIILLVLGIWIFVRLFRKKQAKHDHPHFHVEGNQAYIHRHAHQHENADAHEHTHRTKKRRGLSFGIGFVHGLAGVSHLILLLPVLSFESSLGSLSYIAGFGIGSVLAMVVYALVIGLLSRKVNAEHHPRLNVSLRFAAGLFALVVGVFWLM
jgi:ABC-type nickel/cobalt efflux system permease component RcnA